MLYMLNTYVCVGDSIAPLWKYNLGVVPVRGMCRKCNSIELRTFRSALKIRAFIKKKITSMILFLYKRWFATHGQNKSK